METVTVPMHAHRCMACADKGKNVVWIHGDDQAGVVQAHKCPQCGEVQWKKWLIEPGRLPQVTNAHGQINFDTVLGYIMLAVGIAILGYTAFIYVKKWRNGKKTISNLPH